MERINAVHKPAKAAGQKRLLDFSVNLLLLAAGFAVSASGAIIQIRYHVGHHPDTSTVLALDRMTWYALHVWASGVFLLAAGYHLWAHKKWYKHLFGRKPLPNRTPTTVLTLLTTITVITGFAALLLSPFECDLRSLLVEIHDKAAIPFLIIAFLHTKKRWKWYAAVVKNKLTGKS